MDGFSAFLFLCFLVFVIWKTSKKSPQITKSRSPMQAMHGTYSQASSPEVSEFEIKNARRKRFVELYQASNWQGVVDEFDGYDFKQHYEEFNDYQGMAIAWMNLGNDERAKEYIEQAASSTYSLNQKSEAYLNMAILYRNVEKYQQALEWVLKSEPSQLRAMKDWPHFYRAIRVGAECFMKLGLIDEGINFLKQAPTSARILDRDLADVFEWLGQFYEQKGDFGKALKSYQKVVTVRYDKEINRRILDLNQLIYESEKERDYKRSKRKRKDDDNDL